MSLDARDSPTIQRLLERLPEFRPTFDAFVAEEDGELGSVQAMAELGRWAFPSDDEALLRRVFAAVDEVYADRSLADGHDLAIEFFEAVCDADRPRFEPHIGSASRAWFDLHGW
jgi:hypothetical protein